MLEQVWFPGVHSDVGGGYPASGLADAAFLWMVGKAKDCGLLFREAGSGGGRSPGTRSAGESSTIPTQFPFQRDRLV